MSGDEAEYEVETIVRAKVTRGKRGKKSWLYCVKWKNYSAADNTWEPVDSFAGGSEHFIERFWDRVSTGGRDYNDLSQFSVDEEFFPSGPPRRKKARKSNAEAEIPLPTPAAEPVDSENEVRSIIGDDDEHAASGRGKRRRSSTGAADAESSPPKRKRGRPPGIRPSELEEREASASLARKQSVRELPRTNRGRGQVAESSAAASGPPPLPRRRGRPSKAAPRASSSSPDELLLLPEGNGKASSSRMEKAKAEAPIGATQTSPMIMDDSEPEDFTFGAPSLLTPDSTYEVIAEPGPSTAMPAHRSRAANPRVKMLDDPNLTEASGAISVKARFMKRIAAANSNTVGADSPARSPRVSTSKPGPGKTSAGLVVGGSRLVAQKGKLTTLRANAGVVISKASEGVTSVENGAAGTSGREGSLFSSVDLDEVPGLGQFDSQPRSPPTGQELLKAAGIDPSAGADLPDFEEDAEGEDDIEYIGNLDQGVPSAQLQTRQDGTSEPGEEAPTNASREAHEVPPERAPEKPAVVLEAKPVTFATRVSSAWNQSTIFGPLTLGFAPSRNQGQLDPTDSSSQPKRYALNLNLDPAVSLPLTLKDTHASTSFLEQLDATARNPSGKFYKDQSAIALVNTLRPHGSYAWVATSEDATEEHKKHFQRFVSRLVAGEMFIQMNRFEPLVMCASENSVLGQKLGIPAPLLGLPDTVVMTHVSIEDHCAYAEAAEHADDARW
ncbi:hypothetical protein BV20DRAFT_1110710 [Pilatotrama ljubarskyi]|nr:hypothetical protein BV20DRAFT_1110710 [Pilatotrama ljubarskyi]